MARIDTECHRCIGLGVEWTPQADDTGTLRTDDKGAVLLWPVTCTRCGGSGRFTPKPKKEPKNARLPAP